MINSVKKFMHQYGLTIPNIAKKSGANQDTLTKIFNYPIKEWRLSVFEDLALAANTKTDYVVKALQNYNWKLIIDNDRHAIQGVRITNSDVFNRIKTIVKKGCQQGWKPNKRDVKELVNSDYDPSPLVKGIIADYKLKKND